MLFVCDNVWMNSNNMNDAGAGRLTHFINI